MDIVNRARELRILIESLSFEANDQTVKEYPEILPSWSRGKDYAEGDRVFVNGKLYKISAPYASQNRPLLVFEEAVDEDTQIAEWSEARTPYSKNDKVLFNGDVYICTINGNSWTPTVYPNGWRLEQN